MVMLFASLLILFYLQKPSYAEGLFVRGWNSHVTVAISPEVAVDLGKGNFSYKFTLNNSRESAQEIQGFIVITDQACFNLGAPKCWVVSGPKPYRHPRLPPMVEWYAAGFLEDRDHNRSSPPPSPFNVKPGNSLSDFSFESKSLPGIVDYCVDGYARLLTTEEQPEGSFPPGYTYLDDLFKGKTVGPVKVNNMSPSELVDRLLILLDESEKVGWLTVPLVKSKLSLQLREIKAHLSDSVKAVKESISLLVAEIDTQRGKAINENGWALLKSNTEFLYYQIEK